MIEISRGERMGRILSLLLPPCEDQINIENFAIHKTENGFEIKSGVIEYFDMKADIEKIEGLKAHETLLLYEFDNGEVKKNSPIANIFFRLLNDPKTPVTILTLYENETGYMTATIAVIPTIPLLIEEMKWVPKPGYCGEYHSLSVRMLP
ncbi:MAG: hypothetical protein QXG35_07255 [Nitrososphaerota archaeon]